MLKLPQNLLSSPFSMAKSCSTPPPSHRGKTSLAPPYHFVAPLPVVNDWSLSDFPDHVTIREKSVNTGLVRQTWGFSLFEPM